MFLFNRGGTCQINPVPSCMKIMNTTLLDHRESPRFIDNKLGIPITEVFLREMIKIIDQYTNEDKTCKKIMTTMVCQYTVPPCKSDGSARSYCQEDCFAIFKRCKDSLNQVGLWVFFPLRARYYGIDKVSIHNDALINIPWHFAVVNYDEGVFSEKMN